MGPLSLQGTPTKGQHPHNNQRIDIRGRTRKIFFQIWLIRKIFPELNRHKKNRWAGERAIGLVQHHKELKMLSTIHTIYSGLAVLIDR